jgi:tripartite-type tricarboxylate transporter receptor subunit TctC
MAAANVQYNYIPYENAGDVVVALLGKNVEIGTVNVALAVPYAESGELRIIAQGASKRQLPDVPTVYETPGLTEDKFPAPFWTHRAIIAHVNTPEPMLKAWDKLITQVVTDPEWEKWIAPRNTMLDAVMLHEELTATMRKFTVAIREIYNNMISK